MSLPETCPKCGNVKNLSGGVWEGPRFKVMFVGSGWTASYEEVLAYKCNRCGYVVNIPCKDAQ